MIEELQKSLIGRFKRASKERQTNVKQLSKLRHGARRRNKRRNSRMRISNGLTPFPKISPRIKWTLIVNGEVDPEECKAQSMPTPGADAGLQPRGRWRPNAAREGSSDEHLGEKVGQPVTAVDEGRTPEGTAGTAQAKENVFFFPFFRDTPRFW